MIVTIVDATINPSGVLVNFDAQPRKIFAVLPGAKIATYKFQRIFLYRYSIPEILELIEHATYINPKADSFQVTDFPVIHSLKYEMMTYRKVDKARVREYPKRKVCSLSTETVYGAP